MASSSLTRFVSIVLLCAAAPATAQLLPHGGGLTAPLGGILGGPLGGPLGQGTVPGALPGPLGIATFDGPLSPRAMLALRRDRLRSLVRANRAELDIDNAGAPIRRDEAIAIGATPAALDGARAAGFGVVRSETIAGLDLTITVLKPPSHVSAREAVARLREGDRGGSYELNHIYQPAGSTTGKAAGAAASSPAPGGTGAIGLIDGGIGTHPAFASAHIEQRGFAGPVQPSGHGTAVASLLVGDAGAFQGAAPGTLLLAADVYGGSPAAGSAEAIAQALGWLVTRGVKVINISLVGPANRLLEATVRAAVQRGIVIVAAVGNDGPAAPVQYPAAYDGVVAVTAVDPHGRVLSEAGAAAHLDFAAPGSEMAGAVPGGRYETLRGTSFAAPIVAAKLLLAVQGHAAIPIDAVAAAATPGKAVGRGIVCAACRIAPRAVGLR